MMKTGICSVTFREKTPEDIIELAHEAGLDTIEWGGDVHVPPGDVENARKVGELTRDAGLEVSAYGSYYHAGNDESFLPVIETAQELGTKNIRIWAGKMDFSKEHGKIDEKLLAKIVDDVKKNAQIAHSYDMTLHFEYHGWTYTDTPESAKLLIEKINEPNVYLYWQPSIGISKEERLKSIESLQQWIRNIHVFQWDEKFNRYPLEDGIDEWTSYIHHIRSLSLSDHVCLLEFVKDDSFSHFTDDAKTLKQLLA